MTDIFVSYSRKDREIVRQLIPILEAQGWSVFWDPSIEPGRRWDDLISKTLHDARCIVVCWSQNSVLSSWVKDEAGIGRDREALVPVSIDGALPPLGFRQIQTAFLDPNSGGITGSHLDQLLSAVRRMLGASASDDEYATTPGVSSLSFDFSGPGSFGGVPFAVDPDGTFVIDMLNEFGDGFESAYALAYLATTDTPSMRKLGIPPPGSALVLGVNELHPRPSLDRYEAGLIRPLALARPDSTDRRPLFATPGYHRSADSVAHFQSLFGAARSRAARGIGINFGGWQTYQTEMYFALGLPHDWW